jgi:phosphoglycerate dehydrogenase-like enzyme
MAFAMNVLLMYSTHVPSDGHRDRLKALGCSVQVARSEEEALELAPHAEVVLGHRYLRQILPVATHLRWVLSTAGGVDHLPLAALKERGILLTRSVCMSPTIARHMHTMAWALQRGLDVFGRCQQAAIWSNDLAWLPAPRRAMVIGAGSIGKEIVRLLENDGLEVVSVRRSGPDWRALLPETDWVFLALPATPATTGIFDRAALARLPRTAGVFLAGRAETVDFPALCAALTAGSLGCAAVDLLPLDWRDPAHPVWQTPRLLITPHIAAHAAERGARHEEDAENQIARYLRGEPPAHGVVL